MGFPGVLTRPRRITTTSPSDLSLTPSLHAAILTDLAHQEEHQSAHTVQTPQDSSLVSEGEGGAVLVAQQLDQQDSQQAAAGGPGVQVTVRSNGVEEMAEGKKEGQETLVKVPQSEAR
jgi:hypothetical protein